MRAVVPSSKVGSCESANAAADRDSAVEAAGFAAVVRAGAVPGAAVAGLAAVPLGATFWPSADVPANAVSRAATIVILRISDVSPGQASQRLVTNLKRVAF